MMPDHPDETPPRAEPRILRPVRHRGATAAALRPVSEADEMPFSDAPATAFIDTFASAVGRMRLVD
jgi:hypothetical protein